MDYRFLKKRIKKNEGFSNIVYKDRFGNPTIGYGHLIKPNEKNLFLKKQNKALFFILPSNPGVIQDLLKGQRLWGGIGSES